MVDHVNNGEEGFSVREKLNTVIDRTNTLNGIENQVESNKSLSQQNKARIDKEIQDRIAGDNALDARVDKEIADRKAADQANQSQSDARIDQEIQDRIDGDKELWDHVNDVEDQLENLDVSILDDKIDKEIQDRTEADANLQSQIDAIDTDQDGSVGWDEVQGKPETFPPSVTYQIGTDKVMRKDNLEGPDPSTMSADPAIELVDSNDNFTNVKFQGLNGITVTSDLQAIIIDAGSDEGASNTLEGSWEYKPEDPEAGQFTTRNDSWIIATSITLNKFDITGYEHNFALMNEGDIIFIQAPAGGAEYSVVGKDMRANDCVFNVNAISSYGAFPADTETARINFIPQVSSGSSVHIGPTAPDPALEGQQWLEVPATPGENATMWIFDGANWLQHPSGGSGGGGESLWTENGDDIYYDKGNVGIGTSPSRKLHVAGGDEELFRVAGISAQLRVSSRDTKDINLSNPAGSGAMSFSANGEDRLTINAVGNVGIGTDSPNRRLTVNNNTASIVAAQYNRDNTAGGGTSNAIYQYSNDGVGRLFYSADDAGANNKIQSINDLEIEAGAGNELRFNTAGTNTRLTIDNTGKVGIGMAPATRTAKEQLAEWKTRAKVSTWSEVTDGEFSQEPTEDLVAQWIETRAAGDKLQVAGNISAIGSVSAQNHVIPSGAAGAFGVLGSTRIETFDLPAQKELGFYAGTKLVSKLSDDGNATFFGEVNATRIRASNDLVLNKATDNRIFYTDDLKIYRNGVGATLTIDATGNATFSGTVNTDVIRRPGASGLAFGANYWSPVDSNGAETPDVISLGSSFYKFKDGFFSGTVSDGSGPLMSKRGLITTLSTLRNATMDETQDIRESLRSAIDELVAGFEQEIATMPAPEPEASTMPAEDSQ